VYDIGDNARLLALADLAMADAGITAWDKFHIVFWRPMTAIREGGDYGIPETAGDPNWQPFINTPNYFGVHLGRKRHRRTSSYACPLLWNTPHDVLSRHNEPGS
jgi:hypothetical protein